MNEIAKLQVNALAKTAQERGLFCQIKEVNTGELKLNKSGMYIMFGTDQATVESFARKDPDGLYDLARSQVVKYGFLYPKCQIIQITDANAMVDAANVLDKMITLEFLRDKSKDFGTKIAVSEMEYSMGLLASFYYREALNMEYPASLRESAMKSCKMVFEYLGSGCKDMKEFFSKHKEYLTEDSGVLEFAKGNIYESKEPNNVKLEHLFYSGRKITACAIEEKDLPDLEKMLCSKGINYHIDPNYTISDDFGTSEVLSHLKGISKVKARVWHQVYYDDAYDSLINGWYSARYYSVLKDHAKYLTYEPNNKKYIPMTIPAAWIEAVGGYLNDIKANYYFDINGAYTATSDSAIGILVDNQTDAQRVVNAVNNVINAKMKYKEIDKVAEIASLGKGKDQQKAKEELEARKQQQLPDSLEL